MTNKTLITGFPRVGENRELKKTLENYWTKKSSLETLQDTAKELRKKHWLFQKENGIDFISSNDFSYYDNMLDTIVMLNAIPKRFTDIQNKTEQYFAMARGNKFSVAMEMTKWFNTNYHYIVPELDDEIKFKLNSSKILSEYAEAKSIGIKTKINIIGPITFLGLSKTRHRKDSFEYFYEVLNVYKELLFEVSKLDDSIYVQMEEPILVKNPTGKQLFLLNESYQELASVSKNVKIIVTTYFEHSNEATKILSGTPVWGIGLDFVHGSKNIDGLKNIKNKKLIAGVVDGRNIWISDFDKTIQMLKRISKSVPKKQIIISTSCSLLHSPYSLSNEPESNVRKWLAFSCEKVKEIAFIANIFSSEKLSGKTKKLVEDNHYLLKSRSDSDDIRNEKVSERLRNLNKVERDSSFEDRRLLQKNKLNLPELPTTTIGSFPQTPELRKLRRNFKNGCISVSEYESKIKKYIDDCILIQEEIGLDVLVHGEPERNDMVEYFGEILDGFHFTKNAWVQSYGSRCVKPPIIYGDVSRPEPMTVKWITHAQSKTSKIVKGMLTGPVTILNWSFVRNDIPRSLVSKQIAIALSDEVKDLQEAVIKIIQVDEAAFKEGYPLRKENIIEYEQWAVESFKIAVSTANTETQIHTHMCYSDFNSIIKTIEAMDADVITIETARSGNKLLKIFKETGYKNEIGPGVYDIHSPRIPSAEEFIEQIITRLTVINKSKMWVNPDCGLKTRKWEEVKPSLKNMVDATRFIRNS